MRKEVSLTARAVNHKPPPLLPDVEDLPIHTEGPRHLIQGKKVGKTHEGQGDDLVQTGQEGFAQRRAKGRHSPWSRVPTRALGSGGGKPWCNPRSACSKAS